MTVSIFTEANQFLRTGQLDKAVIAYHQVIDQNPLFYWYHENLGEALAKVGRVEDAIAAFRQAVALNSKSPWSLYQLGELLRRQEQFEEAVFFLRQAVETKSDVPEFYLSLREALVKLGQSSEAAEVYQRAKKLNPRLLDLHGDWQKLQGDNIEVSNRPGVEQNLTVTAIQDCILQYASLQKKLKLDQPKKKSTVFRSVFDSQKNKNDTSPQIHDYHQTIVSEQSGLKADLIQEDEKYILALRLSGIIEDIQKDPKPAEIIDKSQVVRGTISKVESNRNNQPCEQDFMPQKNDQPNQPFDYHKYPRYLNLGCGYDIRPGYLNVDFQERHNPDLMADIRLLDMLPSGYYEEIVAQDCLEHFPRTDTELALKEWHRLLKMGGILKLRVPDIASAFAILNSSTDINHQKGWIQMIFGTQAYTGDFHFTSFTEVLVRHYLEDAGFKINELQLHDRWLFDIVAEKIN